MTDGTLLENGKPEEFATETQEPPKKKITRNTLRRRALDYVDENVKARVAAFERGYKEHEDDRNAYRDTPMCDLMPDLGDTNRIQLEDAWEAGWNDYKTQRQALAGIFPELPLSTEATHE